MSLIVFVDYQLTDYILVLVVLDVPQELLEVEVFEEYPAHVLVVDRVQDLLLRQGLNLLPGLLIVVPLKMMLSKEVIQNVSPDLPTIQ